MPYLLQNNNLKVQLDLPTENYQLSRFDWTGKITQLSWKDLPLLGNEFPQSEKRNLGGRGLYNEFGMETCPGFEEAGVGEGFHKIGVGSLRKNSSTYNFQEAYQVRPLQFDVKGDRQTLRIECESPLLNGYAYLLRKVFRLYDHGLILEYQLHNQGHKPIHTEEYTHNFLCINQQLLGPEYTLRFPFDLQPDAFGETLNPAEAVQLGKREVRFRKTPPTAFFFSHMAGPEPVPASWTLSHRLLGLSLSETLDQPAAKVNLWGMGHVISPELFVAINLKPGDSMNWTRKYEVQERQE